MCEQGLSVLFARAGAVAASGVVAAAGFLTASGFVALFASFPVRARAEAPAAGKDVPLGAKGEWRLLFRDEFDGKALDRSKWATGWFDDSGVTIGVNEPAPECYDPANVKVGDGVLSLAVEKREIACGKLATVRPNATSLIQSNKRFEFTFGFLEARIHLPGNAQSVFNWPSFWADGQNWPVDGEIDVMEGLNGKVCFSYHHQDPKTGKHAETEDRDCPSGDWSGWHVFGAEWKEGSIDYFYDGRKVGSVTSHVSRSPMYLLLGHGTNGKNVKAPEVMLVDYVRVWQRPK